MKRVEAAAKALYEHNAIDDFGGIKPDYPADEFDCCAKQALEAADKVMFSEANIERIARLLANTRGSGWSEVEWDSMLPDDWKKPHRDLARAVIAALREEA